jgi:hypothetical protein
VTDALPSIFISHAHEDTPLAQQLAPGLSDRGYHVWIDEVELRIGDSLVERIADASAEGDFVLAIVSPDSLRSKWCQQELSWAATKGIADRRVIVLPIRHRGDGCGRSERTERMLDVLSDHAPSCQRDVSVSGKRPTSTPPTGPTPAALNYPTAAMEPSPSP